MNRLFTASWRLSLVLAVVLLLGSVPASSPLAPDPAFAQSDIAVDPKTVSPTVNDLRPGFQLVPEKTRDEEPLPGIRVYELDFTRDQTRANFANGPIEIKSLVARTVDSQQAAEQFASSRQALVTASPAWVESKVAKLGDEATGLTMEGQSADGQPAVAHLYLFRRGAMVVGITVAGLTKPTRMAEAEAIAAVVLRKMDPAYRNQTGVRQARPLNTQRPASNAVGPSTGTTQVSSTTGGQRVRVANTGGTGVRLRAQPSLSAQIVARLADGTVLEVVGEDRQADGHTWKNVRAPGDGRGWVSAAYVVPVSGGTASTGSTQASTSPSPTTTSNARTSTAGSSDLKVDVSAKQAKLKAGQEQTLEITVTKNGQPVSGAQVAVATSPTGESPPVPNTGSDGKTRVTWKPAPPSQPGQPVGVGVSAVSPDGSAGVGTASFEVTS